MAQQHTRPAARSATPAIKKVLIANRGEIALRVLRACREMGIATVAVHSTADATAMHVRLADESVCIGPPSARDSYLNTLSILAAAEITGADAIHPGYGFLSENADFAQMVVEHGFVFIGPDPQHIRVMGDKVAAKTTVLDLGLPTVPGSPGALESDEEAQKLAEEIGYPVLIKALAGGGGRGMTVVYEPGDFLEQLRTARNESRNAFGDDRVYLEKYLDHPRHIEVQVMGDRHGNVIHLGERDCSLQRRHQKLVEEALSPMLDDAARAEMGRLVSSAMAKLNYVGAGTVEFLYQDGEFYFIEMNTRIQVEHPVTEMVTGLDLVREQISVAAGEPLSLRQEDIRFTGHAIEVRINAEDPKTLIPQPGLVTAFHTPGGPGVRVDSAIYDGYRVPSHYDSLIAKLIVHDLDRERCLARLQRSLAEFVIDGIPTGIPLLQAVLAHDDVRDNRYDTGWLTRFISDWTGAPD